MVNGLFDIYQSRDIYFTIDMWQVLSHKTPHINHINAGGNKDSGGEEEQKEP